MKLFSVHQFAVEFASSSEKQSGLSDILHFWKKNRDRVSSFSQSNTSGSISPKNFGNIAKAAGIIVVVGLVVYGLSQMGSLFGKTAASKPTVKEAKAVQDIQKEFSFPLTDAKGEEISKIKYYLEKAELRDEIIAEGKRANSVEGREFLVVTLKITNEYEKSVKINSKDYIRLSVNGLETLAPDFHNDPVEVQAISTKYTRVAFPINESDKNLVLRVGEIESEKEEILLTIK